MMNDLICVACSKTYKREFFACSVPGVKVCFFCCEDGYCSYWCPHISDAENEERRLDMSPPLLKDAARGKES